MPENPNLNSVRMQRAQRINNIEDTRLATRLYLMNKEKKHLLRIASQDMRMVNLTLGYIQSSSGYSPEALPPDYVEKQVEKEEEPCFMYGERLRRWKKSRRAQSAPIMSRRQEDNEEEKAPNPSTAKSLSASQQKGWGSAYFPMEMIREYTGAGEKSKTVKVQARIRPKTSAPREAFVSKETEPRTFPNTAGMDEKQINAMKEDLEKSLELSRQELAAMKLERKQVAHGRKAAITQAVNQVRVMTTSARRSRNVTPMQALVKAPTRTIRQKEAWQEKMSLNTNRNERLDAKLRIFMSNNPSKRSPMIDT